MSSAYTINTCTQRSKQASDLSCRKFLAKSSWMDLVWHHSKNAHIRTHTDRVLWSILCGVLVRYDCCCCCNSTNGPRVWFQLNENANRTLNANICNKIYRDMFVSIARYPFTRCSLLSIVWNLYIVPAQLYMVVPLHLSCTPSFIQRKLIGLTFRCNFSAAFQKKKKRKWQWMWCVQTI